MQFFGKLYSQRTFQKGDRLLFEIVNRAGRLIGYQFGVDEGASMVTAIDQVADFDLDAREAVAKWLGNNGVQQLKEAMVEIAMEEQASARPGTIDAMIDQLGDPALKAQFFSLLKDALAQKGLAPKEVAVPEDVVGAEKVDGGTVLYKGEGKNREFVPDDAYIERIKKQEEALETGEASSEEPVGVGAPASEMGEQIKHVSARSTRSRKAR